MDYEKKYNEILAWAKKYKARLNGVPIEDIFPELRESEDERIRKWLIDYFSSIKATVWVHRDITCEQILDWLEKQKDASKAIEAVDRIDKYIDEHLANAHDMKDSNPDKKYYRGWDDALGKMAGILQDVYSEKENKFAPRVLPCSAAWFEDGDEVQKPAEKQDYSGLNDLERAIHRGFLAAGVENVPVTIIKETAKECLAEMKPAEWSEEDADILNCCISSIEEAKENRYAYKETDGDTSYDREIDWLKSLRPSWKPSDQDELMKLKYAGTSTKLD